MAERIGTVFIAADPDPEGVTVMFHGVLGQRRVCPGTDARDGQSSRCHPLGLEPDRRCPYPVRRLDVLLGRRRSTASGSTRIRWHTGSQQPARCVTDSEARTITSPTRPDWNVCERSRLLSLGPGRPAVRAKLTQASPLATFEPPFAGFPTPRPTERVRQRPLGQRLRVLCPQRRPRSDRASSRSPRVAARRTHRNHTLGMPPVPTPPKRTSTPGKSVTRIAREVPTAGRRRIVSADPSGQFGKSTAELPAAVSTSKVSTSSLMRTVAASATSWKRSGLLTRP